MDITIHAVLVDQLLSRRGSSGGWGYRTGGQYSAEATALATLAVWQRLDAPARATILDHWKSHQLPGGGWSSIAPPSSGGNWPTAIIANTLAQVAPNHPSLLKALRNLVSAEPGEAFWLWRLKFRTTDTQVRFDPAKYGWGWVSDSVSWVIPTAGAILALERGRSLGLIRGKEVERRLALGCSMLLDRMCPGGGWNAGNSVLLRQIPGGQIPGGQIPGGKDQGRPAFVRAGVARQNRRAQAQSGRVHPRSGSQHQIRSWSARRPALSSRSA